MIGDFVPGMIGGSGGAITVDPVTGKTRMEIDEARFRDSMVVPKITYNTIEVISGDQASTFAFGTVKSVNRESRTFELDLLDGEVGTLKANDICRGVFHSLEGGNLIADAMDGNGFLNYAGFATAYFTPSQILVNEPGMMQVRYNLQPGTEIHPMPGMNFFAYGSFTDPDRQSMTYQNRLYTRRLKNMDTWNITPSRNIAMQDGLLDGLNIGGMAMSGYGSFSENNYLTGVNIQFTPSQLDELRGKSAYNVSLSSYERVAKLDDEGNIISLYEEMNVISGDENVVSEDENVITSTYNLSTRVQAFKGEEELLFSDSISKGRYVVVLSAKGCLASMGAGILTINEITDFEECYVDLRINCEGNAVFDKRFSVVIVRNGADGEGSITADFDDGMQSVACDSAGNVTSGLPSVAIFSMFYGSTPLTLDSLTLGPVAGVTATANKNTGEVTVTAITASASDTLRIPVTGKGTYNGVQYERTIHLSVNKVRPGAPGENAVIYSLLPSVSVIKRNSAGQNDVANISCKVFKTDGASTSEISSLPIGYELHYKIDSNASVKRAPGYSQATSAATNKVEFILYKVDEFYNRLDNETVYVVKDGIDGEGGIIYDLDNSIASVACKPDGEVLFGLPVETTFAMYYGTGKLTLSSLSVSSVAGVTASANKDTGKISVTAITKAAADVIRLKITGIATYEGVSYTRELYFTINKVKSGDNPKLYSIVPGSSFVKKNANGTYTPAGVFARVRETTSEGSTVLSSLPEGFRMLSSPASAGSMQQYAYGSVIELDSSFDTGIKFRLLQNEYSIDEETIPVLEDGAPGKDGKFTELRYKYAFSKPATPAGINPAGWLLSNENRKATHSRTGNFVVAGQYYASPLPAGTSETYKDRLTFTTSVANQVVQLELAVSSEPNYDFGIVTFLDTAYVATGDYLWRKSGIVTEIIEIVVPTPGSHFIEIVYKKDASGSQNEDRMKYRLVHPHTCWLSTAVIDPDTNTTSGWSEPVEFPTDSPGEEQIYLLAKSDINADMPASDLYIDEYIGDAPEYVSTKAYVRGNIVKYSSAYKICLVPGTGINPGTANWQDVLWWSDNPMGASESYPYEYACSRKFTSGKWGEYEKYRMFMRYGKDGIDGVTPLVTQLIPSVTQIGRTMTGSYAPSSFTVSHKDSSGSPVTAYMAVWGSNDGSSWTRIGNVENASSKTVNVASYPYRYFVIRTYAASSATWGSEYLLSVSVNVLADGQKGEAGPMPVYCGFFKSGETYTYTDSNRDIINYGINGQVFTFQVKTHGASVTAAPTSPTGDSNWEAANKYSFVAMDTALIDGANIAGFMYKSLVMMSRTGTLDGVEIDIKDVPEARILDFEPHTYMNGNTGEITSNKIKATGSFSAPFEEYSSLEELLNGRSLSWYVRYASILNGVVVSSLADARYNGSTLRIYNASDLAATFTLYTQKRLSDGTLSEGGKTIYLPSKMLFEAIGVPSPNSGYTRFIVKSPHTYNSSNNTYTIQDYG